MLKDLARRFVGKVFKSRQDEPDDAGLDYEKLRRTVYVVLKLLAERNQEGLLEFCKGGCWSIDDIIIALDEYPATFIPPPNDDVESIIGSLIRIRGADPIQWHVDANMWTEEEGISDMKAILFLTDSPDEYYEVELYALNVL